MEKEGEINEILEGVQIKQELDHIGEGSSTEYANLPYLISNQIKSELCETNKVKEEPKENNDVYIKDGLENVSVKSESKFRDHGETEDIVKEEVDLMEHEPYDLIEYQIPSNQTHLCQMNLWDLPRTEEDAVRLLQAKGILSADKNCNNGHRMKIYFGSRIYWKCNIKNCKQQIGIRAGNWLSNSRLSLVTVLRFIYAWCWEISSVRWCERELGIGKNCVIDWNNYMREVCVNSVTNLQRTTIGGEGMVVEIDESMFTRRRNNTGRILPQQWIFKNLPTGFDPFNYILEAIAAFMPPE